MYPIEINMKGNTESYQVNFPDGSTLSVSIESKNSAIVAQDNETLAVQMACVALKNRILSAIVDMVVSVNEVLP